jgi:UDP-N-acetylglucosamine 4,6-dehydratase
MCKALAERVFIYANRVSVSRGLKFSAVRGGNVWGSRGSVVEIWKADKAAGRPIAIYNPETLRFHLPMPAWVEFVWRALNEQHGGEIFVPKLRAWSLGDLAEAVGGDKNFLWTRDGDKPVELLIAPHEVSRTVDLGWSFVVEPAADLRAVWNYEPYDGPLGSVLFFGGDQYSSDRVKRLSIADLRSLL